MEEVRRIIEAAAHKSLTQRMAYTMSVDILAALTQAGYSIVKSGEKPSELSVEEIVKRTLDAQRKLTPELPMPAITPQRYQRKK